MRRLVLPSTCILLALCGPAAAEVSRPNTDQLPMPGEAEAERLNADERFLAAVRSANTAYQLRLELLHQERIEAMSVLGRLDDHTAIAWVVPYLDADIYGPRTLHAAITALARLDAISATPHLRKLSEHENIQVKTAAINALTILDQMTAREYREEADDEDPTLRAVGVVQSGVERDQEASKVLIAALQRDPRDHIRRMAAISLTKLGNRGAGEHLARALTDADALVRRYAAEGLAKLDYGPGIPYLIFALEANVAGKHIHQALVELTGQDFGYEPGANVLERQRAVERGFDWWTDNRDRFQ
ncbi:MAG: HEAT repeat domain-containing protein [Planctomycetota bacterium]